MGFMMSFKIYFTAGSRCNTGQCVNTNYKKIYKTKLSWADFYILTAVQVVRTGALLEIVRYSKMSELLHIV